MPQRFLRPGIRDSSRFNAVSMEAQSLYIRLLTLVDDFGRYDGRASVICSHCFAVWNDANPKQLIDAKETARLCGQMEAVNLIEFHTSKDGKLVLQMTQWNERARGDSKWPLEPDSKPQRNPAESCGILPKAADEAPTPFLNTPLVMESSAASKRFQKPSLDEVKLACAKCGLPESEAERFWNYYDSVGWKVGKNPMKSWTSALAGTWKSNWQERNQQQTTLPKKKEISVFDSL